MRRFGKFLLVLLVLTMVVSACNRKSGCPANQALQNQQRSIEEGSYKPTKAKSGALPTDGKAKKYKSKYR